MKSLFGSLSDVQTEAFHTSNVCNLKIIFNNVYKVLCDEDADTQEDEHSFYIICSANCVKGRY